MCGRAAPQTGRRGGGFEERGFDGNAGTWLKATGQYDVKGSHMIRSFIVRNRIFTVALLLAALVRAITAVAFRPAIWFGGDSADYLAVALRMRPDLSRMSGYGIMLFILRPLHSVMAVVAVQHVMGLLIGLGIYLLLHERFGLPGWGATLAAVPVLFDAYQIELEHEVLSDVLFEFLIMAALFLALWRWRDRPAWADITAGLLVSLASLVRPIALPLLVVYLCYLLLRRARWRVFAATVIAAAVPIVLYATWFDANYHIKNLTSSQGVYLWSRTMSFANCQVIKPPADEMALCPPSDGRRLAASSYIWNQDSPLTNIPGGRFSAHKNRLALDFARRAIVAQPGGYATAVLHDFMLSFYWNRPPHPSAFTAEKYQFSAAERVWVSPDLGTMGGGTVRTDQRAYTGAPSSATRAYEPYAGIMRAYQRFIYLRGSLLGIILLIGLAAIVRWWRGGGIRRLRDWGGPALLPWITAVGLLFVPVATGDFDLRYVVPAVPAACLAAALAFARVDTAADAAQVSAPAGSRAAGAAAAGQP